MSLKSPGSVARLTLVGLILLALIQPRSLQAAPPAQSGGEGEAIFTQKCTACHTIGGGKLVGPDLKDVTQRRDPAWLSQWILQPDKILAAGDPIATQLLAENNNVPMPNLGLTEAEVAALIAYLGKSGGATVAAPAVTLGVGDADHGRALFTGGKRLANGGPPCMTCHSIAGLGALGGGALGPDLTFAYNTYGGDAGLATFLNTTPTVTMNAVWAQQPLTPAEQDDLRVFMQEASVQQRPPQALWQLAGLSLLGMVLLIAAAHFYWRNRLVSVRKTLVQRARI
ncbi:MAG: cytochrome c [Caldilineales bacterium]|nr:cytochrome c [Caldilineales bacterium]MCW5860075.1 cytochrome c [Caldilineales bacterium]